jgi:hypothetical protein
MWRLREAWILRPISHEEANENGVVVANEEEPWLIEHYTNMTYDVWVNKERAKRFIDDKWLELSGVNPWGFVPVVYIPDIRTYGFYGDNVHDHLHGIVKELNLRIADYGDAVTLDAHSYLGMRHVNGAPTVLEIAPGVFAINLGSNPSITGDEKDPDLFELRKATASTSMADLVKSLYEMYRRFAYIPAVVDGEDEGSQRSGLTLAMRMISLSSHTDTERIFWTTGMIILNRMILKMLAIKGEAGISAQHLVLRIKMEWAPVLPRDREMIVQEAVSLMAAKLGSPERLLQTLGVDDYDKEKDLILDFWEEITEITAKAQPEPATKGVAKSSKQPKSNDMKKESQ